MKIYISQPIQGRSELLILRERTIVEQKLKLSHPDAEFIYRTIRPKIKENHIGLLQLEECIKHMDDADMVYLLDDFNRDRICRVEAYCCIVYDIPSETLRTYDVSEKLTQALLTFKRKKGRDPYGIRMNKTAYEYLKIECRPFLAKLIEDDEGATFEGIPLYVGTTNEDFKLCPEG